MCYRCGDVIPFIPDVTDLRYDKDFPTLWLGFRRDDEGAAITPATNREAPAVGLGGDSGGEPNLRSRFWNFRVGFF